MHHVFVNPEQISGRAVAITGPDVNHIRNVLRMRAGEKLSVRAAGLGNYLCEISALSPACVSAVILSEEPADHELPAALWLFQALPKADKMEWIIQKAVELGAAAVVPVRTARCVVKLDAKKAAAKAGRWNAVSESAARQSGRDVIPRVLPVMNFSGALRQAAAMDLAVIPYEKARGMAGTGQAVRSLKPGMTAAVFIGPEGGFSEEEIAQAEAAGLLPVSLGRRILRTETAGMALLSAMMLHLECQSCELRA